MDEKIVWAFSGGAARWIALARSAEVSILNGLKPDIIIGTSSGSLLAPIVAVAYDIPELMNEAIKFGESLDVSDMFLDEEHKPVNKNGKPTFRAITRILTGYSHLGIQDIRPLYKKVFKQNHFDMLKQSPIKCFAFGVNGKDGSPFKVCLNDANDIDDLINMLELSSRIVPFVQAANYGGELYVDGGFISFCPAMWLFDEFKIKELLTVYSTPISTSVKPNKCWNKSIISVATQMLEITTHYLAFKDAKIEELYCLAHNVPYMRIECPGGLIDELYETDDDQLKALGLASKKNAEELWITSKLTKMNNYDV